MKTREDLIAEILKLFVGTPSEYRALSGAMVGKSELELEKIALELQLRLTLTPAHCETFRTMLDRT
jgi:hypothetical protein